MSVRGKGMEEYLLDTNVCIAVLKNNHSVFRKILSVGQSNCHVSEITIAELFYGAAKSGRESHFNDVADIMRLFDIIPMFPCLREYGMIKAKLEREGQRLDDFDLLIGATALQNNMTMVTANVRHLARIPNLKIENWEQTSE